MGLQHSRSAGLVLDKSPQPAQGWSELNRCCGPQADRSQSGPLVAWSRAHRRLGLVEHHRQSASRWLFHKLHLRSHCDTIPAIFPE